MDNKPQILLLTHGGWGMSLVKGVRMILGAVDFVSEVPLLPEMTLPEYTFTGTVSCDAVLQSGKDAVKDVIEEVEQSLKKER